MLDIMTKDPNFVSIRLPDDVANWLREYATTNNMVRADKPNMGGSIIAIVRAAMQGQTISNSVGQSSTPDIDIEAMIAAAITAQLSGLKASVNDEFVDMKHAIAAAPNLADINMLLDPLLARLEALENTRSEATPANFTQALLQRVKEVAPLKLMQAS